MLYGDTSNTRYVLCLDTRHDINEQISYYMLYRDTRIKRYGLVLETRDIHELTVIMCYGDISNTYVLCRDRLDIHEQVSYYIEIPVTQDTACVLETRLDIHEQVMYYMLYRDTSTQDTSM